MKVDGMSQMQMILMVFLWMYSMSEATEDAWSPIGPPGGTVTALGIDPTNSSILYAGTSGTGVFKSTDGAERWFPANRGMEKADIRCVAIDPRSSLVVYAGTTIGVFRSTDGGLWWDRLTNGPEGTVEALVLAPVRPSVLYAGTHDGVLKRADGETDWAFLDGPAGILSLRIDPASSSTIYAGTDGEGVFKSINGGLDWAPANELGEREGRDSIRYFDAYSIYSLALDPGDSSVLYAGHASGVLKSTDGGALWSEVLISTTSPISSRSHFKECGVSSIAVDPISSSTVYVGTKRGEMYRSRDGGESWQELTGATTGGIVCLSIGPSLPSILYAGTKGGGLLKSTNAGVTWRAGNRGLFGNVRVSAFAVDPFSPGTFYSGVRDGGILKTTDYGRNWFLINEGLRNAKALIVNSLLVHPVNSDKVYAGTDDGLYRTDDGGTHWIGPVGTTDRVYALRAVPDSRTLYAAAWDGAGVMRSDDDGQTWREMNIGIQRTDIHTISPVLDLEIDPFDSETLYICVGLWKMGRPLYVSRDGGGSWILMDEQRSLPNIYGYDLAIAPWDGRMYLSAYAHTKRVYRSMDEGASWSVADNSLSGGFRVLAVDPSDSSIYVGTQHGLFRSTDNGTTWIDASDGLEGVHIRTVTADPFERSKVCVGTDSNGAFVRSFAAEKRPTWVSDIRSDVLQKYRLCPSYPNPFNAETTIRYVLPKPGRVRLVIYDVLGRKVRTLVDREQVAGQHSVLWDGKDGERGGVSSGVYFCRLEMDEKHKEVRRMLVLR